MDTLSTRSVLSLVCGLIFLLAVLARTVSGKTVEEGMTVVASTKSCANTPSELAAGQRLIRELGGGECHAYRLAVQANQFLQVVADQRGIDVVLTIYDENGRELSHIDRPNGSLGRETISLIASVDSHYLLDVRSLEEVSARGTYELTFTPPRLANSRDKTWITAEQLSSYGVSRGRSSITNYERAAELWHSLGDAYEEALALYGAGFSCTSLSENQAAINYLKRALPMFIQLRSTSGEAMVKTALGWSYFYLSDLENAFESFTQAYQIHRATENARGQGISLFGLGWVHAVKGDSQKALQIFSESLIWRRKVMDRRGEAFTLTGIGKMQSRLGRYAEALDSLSLALSILPSGDPRGKADILSNLGWVYKALNENENALNFFNAALTIRTELEDLTGEATTRYGISIVYRNSGRFDEAESEIERALKIVEAVRAEGPNQQLRMSYFASVQDYYEFYITLLMELDQLHPSRGYAAKALYACERASARGLLDLLAETKVDLRQGVDPALVERERVVSEKLNILAIQRGRHPTTSNQATEKTESEINHLRTELEATRAEIRRLNPRYAALTQLQPLTASEIQKQVLDRDTMLLQYVLGEKHSFLLAVTTDEVTSYELPGRNEIESVARQYHETVTFRNHLDGPGSSQELRTEVATADARAEAMARDLSRMLLSPLRDKLTKQRLIVVTSGALQFVPFAALPIPLQSESELSSRLLIDKHELVVLPSLSALSAIRQEAKSRQPASKAVIAFGDPVFDSSDSRVRGRLANVSMSSGGFARLPGSRWEAEKILSLVPADEGTLVLDFAANRNFASSAEFGAYRFVHFATHALIDFEHPALSGILFSMVDQHGKPQNGLLGMEDIFKLKMPVELVVLSGCRTALGANYAGEGLVGLTRAFMYAGALRLAVSLWEVADQPTSELMVRFYQFMLGPQKLTPTAALRAAQLSLRKDPRWRSPYFWAPFIIQGDWR